jgi:hypothetical protein
MILGTSVLRNNNIVPFVNSRVRETKRTVSREWGPYYVSTRADSFSSDLLKRQYAHAYSWYHGLWDKLVEAK